jgi:hypothetical protein
MNILILQSVKNISRVMMDLLRDARHFLVDFHDFLAESAIHTYVTALPLSPKSSMLYKRYGLELGFMSKAIQYHEREWGKDGPGFE